ETVRPLAHFFEEQDVPERRIKRPFRSQRRKQLRDRAAKQHAARFATVHDVESGRGELAYRLRAGDRVQERLAIVASLAAAETGVDHGTVKRGHVALRGQE